MHSLAREGVEVFGVDLDPLTRCAHWHSERDILAIRMKCCGRYYACFDCHAALAGHSPEVWPASEWDAKAVFCGGCTREFSIADYMSCGDLCPQCGAAFNPGCRNHYHLYFEATP